MGDPATCPHAGLYWFAAPANETGWRCVDCQFRPGEPPGFSPQHDRDLIALKVGCIITDLHEAEILYVSNSSCGEVMASAVTALCRRTRFYDSVSIARFILQIEGGTRHGRFWRGISEAVLVGKDSRDRCACGALSTITTWNERARVVACSHEHLQVALGRDPKEPW